MKNTKALKLLAAILLSCTLLACTGANNAGTDRQAEKNHYEAGVENDAPERAEALGNPNFSLSNGIGSGAYWVAAYNGEFYYAALGRGIAKINEKGEETLLTTDFYTWVNVADGWIYYGGKENDCKIVKLSVDGKEKTVLAELDAERYMDQLLVVNDWIYFYSNRELKRINMQGKNAETVAEGEIDIIGIKDEWLYMIEYPYMALYRSHLDGSNKALLYGANKVSRTSFDGDWIYFVTSGKKEGEGEGGEGPGKLLKIRTDGSALTEYVQPPYQDPGAQWQRMNIWVSNGYIYYAYDEDTPEGLSSLRRISLDDNSDEEFIEGRICDVNFAEDWIFFVDKSYNPEPAAYMMKLDKSKKIKLYSL